MFFVWLYDVLHWLRMRDTKGRAWTTWYYVVGHAVVPEQPFAKLRLLS